MKYRVQIAVGGTLVAEAVVENDIEAYRIWNKWAAARYLKDQPMGGAVINRADITRLWNVPVGTLIHKD